MQAPLDSQCLKLDFNERSDFPSRIELNSNFETLWQYPQREALEAKLAKQFSLQPEQVLCTNGGDEAIMLLMRIIKESKKLILPLPAFSQYTWGVESWKLDAELVAANSDLTIDLESTIEIIKQQTQSVTIITRPNNPTGETIEMSRLVELIETTKENDGWVFLDEAYIEFTQSSQVSLKLLQQFDNLIILRTFSKAYGLAGLRVGYILGAPNLINEFKLRCLPFNVPRPSLELATKALSEENTQEVKNYCQIIASNRIELVQWLKAQNINLVESEANFILLQLPSKQAQAVSRFLARNNILVRTFAEGILENSLRITIPKSIERLKQVLLQALRPKLVCFDMDGVLIDTSESYDSAVVATVKALSGIKVSLAEVFELRDSGGFNNDWVLSQALLEKNGKQFDLNKVTDTFQKLYLGDNNDGLVANEKPLINKRLIEKVEGSSQYQFAIVTGRPRLEAQAGMKFLGLTSASLISLDDVKEPKPSPEGVKKLQLEYSPVSWMCGDNPDDMQAANGSNSLAIGIGKRNADALYQAGADIVLENINQLEDWLFPVTNNDK